MSNLRRSAMIAGTTQYVVYILTFIQVAVVSRLLTPDEIGTYLIASSLIVLAAMPRSLGIMEFIVATEELTTEMLRTCFALLMGMAVLITALYLFSASTVAQFFDAAELAHIVPIMALSFLVMAFGILAQGKMRRDMQFGGLALIRLAGAIVGFIVSISLVLRGYGIYGMAWGFLAASLATTLMVIRLAPDMILFRPSIQHSGKILGFGVLTSVGTLLMNLGDLGPQLVLGRATNTSTVGYFGRGQTLVTFLRQGTEAAMSPVVQPWFARIARGQSEIAVSFLRVMGIVSAVTWPAFVFLYFQADFLIPLLLGPAWTASVPIAQALALGGMFSPFATYGVSLQAALGQVGRRLVFIAVLQTLRFTMLGVAVGFGLQAFAWTLSASHVLGFVLISLLLGRTIGLRLSALGASLVAALCMAAMVAVVHLVLLPLLLGADAADWMHFLTAAALCAAFWVIGLRLLKHELLDQMLGLVFRRK